MMDCGLGLISHVHLGGAYHDKNGINASLADGWDHCFHQSTIAQMYMEISRRWKLESVWKRHDGSGNQAGVNFKPDSMVKYLVKPEQIPKLARIGCASIVTVARRYTVICVHV
jgi:hypothetical protein